MPQEKDGSRPRFGVISRWRRGELRDQVERRLLGKMEQLLDTMNGVGETLQKVAELELEIAKRLLPIVDDLGAWVRHGLNEATGRQVSRAEGLPSKSRNVNLPVTNEGTDAPTTEESTPKSS